MRTRSHARRNPVDLLLFGLALAVLGVAPTPSTSQEEKPPPPAGYLDIRAGAIDVEEIPVEGDLPLAGYAPVPVNGAFVQTASGIFRLQFGAFAQVRFTGNYRDAEGQSTPESAATDYTSAANLQRVQIFFEGRYTHRAAYHIRATVTNGTSWELSHAWAQLRFGDSWNLRVGKHVIPLAREDWMLAQDILTTHYSPNSQTFGIGSSIGAFLSRSGQGHRFWLAFHNGAFGGRNTFPATNTKVAVTGRWEWTLRGDDWSVWSDMIGRRGRDRSVMLGLSGAFQSNRDQNATDHEQAAQYNVDLNIDGDGSQTVIATSGTWIDPVDDEAFWGFGLLAQSGLFVTRGGQIYGQYNLVHFEDAPGDPETYHSIHAGYNWFPFLWTNRWKFTAEAGVLLSALNETGVPPSTAVGFLPSDEAGQFFFRLQAQLGF